MIGETNLDQLLRGMKPEWNEGEFVFCSVENLNGLSMLDIQMSFQEKEGITLVLKKEKADELGLKYTFIASWITLTIHSALEAVGLTAAFSGALANNGIPCNVVAAYYHDHIFVNRTDRELAFSVLQKLSQINSCNTIADL